METLARCRRSRGSQLKNRILARVKYREAVANEEHRKHRATTRGKIVEDYLDVRMPTIPSGSKATIPFWFKLRIAALPVKVRCTIESVFETVIAGQRYLPQMNGKMVSNDYTYFVTSGRDRCSKLDAAYNSLVVSQFRCLSLKAGRASKNTSPKNTVPLLCEHGRNLIYHETSYKM